MLDPITGIDREPTGEDLVGLAIDDALEAAGLPLFLGPESNPLHPQFGDRELTAAERAELESYRREAAQKQAAERAEAETQFVAFVEALALGHPVNLAAATEIMRTAGKTMNELQAAVNELQTLLARGELANAAFIAKTQAAIAEREGVIR